MQGGLHQVARPERTAAPDHIQHIQPRLRFARSGRLTQNAEQLLARLQESFLDRCLDPVPSDYKPTQPTPRPTRQQDLDDPPRRRPVRPIKRFQEGVVRSRVRRSGQEFEQCVSIRHQLVPVGPPRRCCANRPVRAHAAPGGLIGSTPTRHKCGKCTSGKSDFDIHPTRHKGCISSTHSQKAVPGRIRKGRDYRPLSARCLKIFVPNCGM